MTKNIKRSYISIASPFNLVLVIPLLAPMPGFEPGTNRLTGDRSTAELHRNTFE